MSIDPASIAATAVISSAIGAVVSGIIAGARSVGQKAIEQSEEEKAVNTATQAALRALLWRELQVIHTQAVDHGGMTAAERRHLESVYGAYHALGGNGTGTRLYEDSMATPVLD